MFTTTSDYCVLKIDHTLCFYSKSWYICNTINKQSFDIIFAEHRISPKALELHFSQLVYSFSLSIHVQKVILLINFVYSYRVKMPILFLIYTKKKLWKNFKWRINVSPVITLENLIVQLKSLINKLLRHKYGLIIPIITVHCNQYQLISAIYPSLHWWCFEAKFHLGIYKPRLYSIQVSNSI